MNFVDETKIQLALFHYTISKGHKIAIPNVSYSWLYWEADFVSITNANFMHEYEIKISLSDFKKDFSKPKHRRFRHLSNYNRHRVPNYFWYAAPLDSIPICVPCYAGIIVVQNSKRYGSGIELIEVKKPKKIHSEKVSDIGIHKMLRTLMFKYWSMAQSLNNLKKQRELFA